MPTCGHCHHMELNNHNFWGNSWCRHDKEYYSPTRSSCIHFVAGKSDQGLCYITTALCNILGQPDDCEIMQKLRDFRDNVMKKTAAYSAYLDIYDTVGPQISKALHADTDKANIADKMLNSYILPAIAEIDKGDSEKAIDIYKSMTDYLQSRYLVRADT